MKTVAAIGVGNIFRTVHHPFFSESCTFAAVCDADGARAKAAAAELGIPHHFIDPAEMLEAVKPDILCVCVPNKFHCASVLLGLRHGCHVLCEKPPALDATEALAMMRLAEEKGLTLGYNLHFRHDAGVALLKKQIAQNRLGRIYHVKVQAMRRRGIPGWGVFTNKELQGGGALIDLGVHMLDTALYLMGRPKVKSILATAFSEIGRHKSTGTLGDWDPGKFEVEDALFALIRFADGSSLSLETAFALNMPEKSLMNVHLYGSEAGASVFPLRLYGDVDGILCDTDFPFVAQENNHARSVTHFLQRCDGVDAPLADGVDGYYLQCILDGLYQSTFSGDVVKYD